MADEKKPSGRNMQNDIIYFLVGLFLLSIFVSRFDQTFWGQNSNIIFIYMRIVYAYLVSYIIPFLKVVSALVSLACVWLIFRILSKSSVLQEEEKEIYGPTISLPQDIEPQDKNGRWERVIELVNSANSSDWRLAIIEADVMLEDLLERMGYHGESIGEMLKGVEQSDFLTLDAAWEAHKIRNKIAHGGSEFSLNEREAKRVIALFESVFKEFKII
jgi:hypothetical protein